jgi:hypothetical protein
MVSALTFSQVHTWTDRQAEVSVAGEATQDPAQFLGRQRPIEPPPGVFLGGVDGRMASLGLACAGAGSGFRPHDVRFMARLARNSA